MTAQQPYGTPLGAQARVLMPVMGATGGSGRSTVAGLLACGLAASAAVGGTVVLDTAARLASPWPQWATRRGAGLAALPPDQPLTPAAIRAAVSQCAGPGATTWELLTDLQPWQSGPLGLPTAPEAWHQLAALGGWQAVVADTDHPLAHDIVSARYEGWSGLTARWCLLPYAIPVLTTTASGAHIAALQTTVMAAEAEGLPLHRAVLAVSSPGNGRPSATVKAALTMLDRKLGAVVRVPYDPGIRAYGLREAARLRPGTLRAARELADAVRRLARAAWGDTLPAASRPAFLPQEGSDARVRDTPRVATAR
ncbi:hypothetical protein [Streptomyces sp. HPF1205]|uniref:hypothetical protein n=1 Tax=Streptomyces sp. HPF1205 TaxID=2873262 RepID=UPI001CEC00D9|nr:hypothetical protein [Streptomyces sp. HPF1205]